MDPTEIFTHPAFRKTFEIVFDLWPIWVPLALGTVFWNLWFAYKRTQFIMSKKAVLLEIRIPKEIFKSPRAMEVALASLYQSGGAILAEVYLDGAVRPWFSLEIVSQGGHLRFFVWAWERYANIFTHQLYSQYPDIEIVPVDDYAMQVEYNPEERIVWGTYFRVGNEVKPLRTYVDYLLDKDPKEEFKIDPMTAVLEYMGNLSPGEQAWYQILIQGHIKEEGWKEGLPFARERYNKKVDEYIEKELVTKTLKVQQEARNEEGTPFAFTSLEPGIDDTIKTLKRFKGQFQFETVIRAFYIAEAEYFNSDNIVGMIGSFRQFSFAPPSNDIKLGWWTDYRDSTKNWLRFIPEKWYSWKRPQYEIAMLNAYKLRSFFHPPYKEYMKKMSGDIPFVMTTEELATLFHIPGGVAQTPTIVRIDSKKAEPPPNLPT